MSLKVVSCLRVGGLEHTLSVTDTGVVALLNTLQSQGSDERGTNARTIFSGNDLNGVTLALGPVEDLAQGLSAAGLKVRVLVEDGAVSADVALGPALLLANCSNTAGRKAGGARTDQLSKATAQLELGLVENQAEPVLEQVLGLRQVLKWVPAAINIIDDFFSWMEILTYSSIAARNEESMM